MQNTRRSLTFALSCLIMLTTQAQAITFKLSAIGYHSKGSKIAVLEDVPENQPVQVTLFDPTRRNPKFPVMLGATVYKLPTPKSFHSKGQGPATQNYLLDFSDFKEPGSYELRLEGTNIKSSAIKVSDFLYWDTLKPVVKSFYFQRCGQEVEDQSLRVFHGACHLKDAEYATPPKNLSVLDDDTSLDVIGGWHNGGDYAKYTMSTALSAARLMTMEEWDPKPFKFFRIEYPIFEPGYGSIDDLHHEIEAGLDWLMAMQRRDGAVYRKVAGKQWPGDIVPGDDDQARYLYGISTPDTAAVSATMAIAARNFKPVDLGYSIKSLMTAEKAWAYLEAHPTLQVERSDSDFSGSGEFISPQTTTDVPFRVWAAAELYVSTGKPKYHQYFLSHLKDLPLQRFSWSNPAVQGIGDYILLAPKPDEQVAASLKKAVLSVASEIATSVDNGLYASGLKQYGKASNLEVVERANLLMLAYRLSGQERFRDAATRSVSYLFGVNPAGTAYVTGVADNSVKNPTHRWMLAMGKVLPGFMVDGPNNAPTDNMTPKGMGAASYVDNTKATSVNESTLLDNAGLAYLLATLNASYNSEKAAPSSSEPKSPLDYKLAPERPKRK